MFAVLLVIVLSGVQAGAPIAGATFRVAPPAAPSDPRPAVGVLRVGTGQCTATVIGPRRADGSYDVLSAAHCTGGPGTRAVLQLPGRAALALVVVVRNGGTDVSWLRTGAAVGALPSAVLHAGAVPVGTAVWHASYGRRRPGQVERGALIGKDQRRGWYTWSYQATPGASGGAVFRSSNSAVIGVHSVAGGGTTSGPAGAVANKLRPR